MRAASWKPWFGLLLALAFLAPPVAADEAALSRAISVFKKAVIANFQDWDAYEGFIAALEKESVLGNMEKFQKVAKQALVPAQMKGKLVNLDGMEAYHRLGIALYDKGYSEEAGYLLDIYKTTRKYTPEQGLKKAREVYDEAMKEPH